ncbi:organomercurial lyase [Streptomyces sp. ZAF1911]|uniref:organomercurial lyase n=1 Tax=Streptomyces sp. ZAF1911 TaxID=2944129 RepID=UPI00237A1B0B|nr:organomercurial lyase [Streptomyces sp. ZAF1911]MDD9375732.1 organomercurial lyase [Streptomyces sp. ZAF1911]
MQQVVLRHFASTGRAPETSALEATAAQVGRAAGEVPAELDREDFLALDEAGRIRAAYPFSATPTRHGVRLSTGVEMWSMCAIDAVGISAMLGQDVAITVSDSGSERTQRCGGRSSARPARWRSAGRPSASSSETERRSVVAVRLASRHHRNPGERSRV